MSHTGPMFPAQPQQKHADALTGVEPSPPPEFAGKGPDGDPGPQGLPNPFRAVGPQPGALP